METSAIKDPLFSEAVKAIDAGNIDSLQSLLTAHPELINTRLDLPEEGYFKNPYLLWFLADNPIRNNKLPANIVDIARLLVNTAKESNADDLQHQLDYVLGLVSTGRVPRECGVQIELINLLIDAGATPGGGHGALAHGNIEAARHLVGRGGELSLATAVGLDQINDVYELLNGANPAEKEIALMMAAFYGKADMLKLLIHHGANINAYISSSSGFHSHASALHQAVSSGSLAAVKLLVEAGANINAKDLAFQGTPLGWAIYMQTEETDAVKVAEYVEIEQYLRGRIKN